MGKFLDRIYDGLLTSPLSTIGALIIFLLALPLIKKGLAEKPPPPAPPAPTPIQIESPWLTQHLVEMHFEIEQIKGHMSVLSNQVKGVAQLIRRRERRDGRDGRKK
jgi:hypothetical protein